MRNKQGPARATGTILAAAVMSMVASATALAQNKILNISPPGGGGCTPGYNCPIQPPQPQPCFGFGCPQPGPIVYPQPVYPQPVYPQPVYPQPGLQPGIQPQPVYPQTAQQPAIAAGQGAGKSQQHIAYCMSKYKSYKPQTNTFTAYSGETKFCNSPYG